MLYKTYKGTVVASIVMLVLGASMATVAMIVTGQNITLGAFMTTWGRAFLINYLASLFIPAADWGNKVCENLKIAPGSLPWLLVSTAVLTLVYVTIVTAGMVLFETGLSSVFWGAFLKMLPILAVCGYVIACIVTGLAVRFADWIRSE